jgi:integrase
LADLSAADFASWRDRSLQTLAGSSVKRERNLLSNVLTIAVDELKWLHDNPLQGVKMPKSNRARDRLLLPEEIEKLKFVLGYDLETTPVTINAKIATAMLFAIETGMRVGEICALTWGDVFLDKLHCRVIGDEIGAGKTVSARRDVPLSPEAIRLLKQLGTDTSSVFNLKASQVDSNFRKAKEKADTEDLHFHDTRANACTQLAKKIDILSLARMLGHKDLKQLQVYYRETAEDTAKKL